MIGGREREVVYRRREKKRGDEDGEIKREEKRRREERGEQKKDTLLPLTVRTTFLAPECLTEGPGKT